ncbi:MAG TPA: hypothetical protein VK465_08730 [Fibrobacteria bacterium]|nr:hypothetical protein [Fibrobacteria bacterium]
MSYSPIRYPKSGVISPQRGLNLADNLFEVRHDEATILKNMIFRRNSLVQRYPFRNYSTTDFTAEGVFRGKHDYKTTGGTARLLFLTNSGKVKERTSSSTEADRVTGLSTGLDGHFATVYDACFFSNGTDALRVGRDTTWRVGGSPAAVSDLAVAQNAGAGIAAGTYLHIVIPVIEVSGVSVVFADWSNIVRTVVAAPIASFGLTWTDIVDTRITAYLVFRTAANGTDFRSAARVAPGVGAYTDATLDTALPVTVSGAPSRPSPMGSWGVPPTAKVVVWSGKRLVFLNLGAGLENALQTSRVAGTSYDAEGVPASSEDGSLAPTRVRLPKDGPITCGFPIGETGENSTRSNNLFVGQENACFILPETNPDSPLIEISGMLGPISQRAIAQDGSFLFFQSRRGVEFWPGSGRDIYLISDKVEPIFGGGGNQQLTANQSTTDIEYEVAENHLWITIRDDSNATGANKCYLLDLLKFRREFTPAAPSAAARFVGPIENTGMGFGHLLRRLDDTLVVFDNQNKRIMSYDKTGTQDQIADTNTDMPVVIQSGALLREDPISQKTLNFAHILQFTSSSTTFRILAEFERVISQADAEPNTYNLAWEDLTWDDIDWQFDTWFSETPLDYGAINCKWCVARIEKTDSQVSFAYFGLILWLWAFQQIRTFR